MNGPKMGWDTGWKPGIQSIPAIAPGYKKQTYPKGAVISVGEKLYISNTAIGTPEDFNKDHWDETDVMSCISDVSGNILDDGSTSETVVVAVPLSQADDYTVGDYYKIQNRVAELRTKTVGDEVCQLTFDTKRGVLEAINDAVSEIGKPLKLIGSATVSELNGTITGLEPGWTYTLTDSGTLTAGTVEVEAGDEVAWGESGVWVKVGGDSGKVVVLPYDAYTHADLGKIVEARKANKGIILINDRGAGVRECYYGTSLNYVNDEYIGESMDFTFVNPETGKSIRVVSDGVNETWSDGYADRVTVFDGMVTMQGTEYPDGRKVASEVDAGRYVFVRLDGVGGTRYYALGYKYSTQYIFKAIMDSNFELRLQYDLGTDSYSWSTYSEPRQVAVFNFQSGTVLPMSSVYAARDGGSLVFLRCSADITIGQYTIESGTFFSLCIDTGRPGYLNHTLEFTCTGIFDRKEPVTAKIILNDDGSFTTSAVRLDAMYDGGERTDSTISGGHTGVDNVNAFTKFTLTSTSGTVIMHTNKYPAVNNFCVEIDNTGNSNDVTIAVQHGPSILKYSTAGGNVVGAGKYVQLTCVGSCWTLAEFTA